MYSHWRVVPEGSEREPTGFQREQNGSRMEAKESQREAVGAKWEPKGSNMRQWRYQKDVKCADPLVGRARPFLWGEVSSPYPPPPWAPCQGAFEKQTVLTKLSKPRPVLVKRVVEHQKSCGAVGPSNFSIILCPLKRCGPFG